MVVMEEKAFHQIVYVLFFAELDHLGKDVLTCLFRLRRFECTARPYKQHK